MLETMYELPSRSDIRECMVTEDVVTKRQQPAMLYKQAS
jgi:ATP-dependent protease Clp ATPase subunit